MAATLTAPMSDWMPDSGSNRSRAGSSSGESRAGAEFRPVRFAAAADRCARRQASAKERRYARANPRGRCRNVHESRTSGPRTVHICVAGFAHDRRNPAPRSGQTAGGNLRVSSVAASAKTGRRPNRGRSSRMASAGNPPPWLREPRGGAALTRSIDRVPCARAERNSSVDRAFARLEPTVALTPLRPPAYISIRLIAAMLGWRPWRSSISSAPSTACRCRSARGCSRGSWPGAHRSVHADTRRRLDRAVSAGGGRLRPDLAPGCRAAAGCVRRAAMLLFRRDTRRT